MSIRILVVAKKKKKKQRRNNKISSAQCCCANDVASERFITVFGAATSAGCSVAIIVIHTLRAGAKPAQNLRGLCGIKKKNSQTNYIVMLL